MAQLPVANAQNILPDRATSGHVGVGSHYWVGDILVDEQATKRSID
jgi:hypothetical protein